MKVLNVHTVGTSMGADFMTGKVQVAGALVAVADIDHEGASDRLITLTVGPIGDTKSIVLPPAEAAKLSRDLAEAVQLLAAKQNAA